MTPHPTNLMQTIITCIIILIFFVVIKRFWPFYAPAFFRRISI